MSFSWGNYTFLKDGYNPSKEAMKKFDEYLLKTGYNVDDILICDDCKGDMGVYVLVARFSSEEFERRFENRRRITLGNMCEIDIIEKR